MTAATIGFSKVTAVNHENEIGKCNISICQIKIAGSSRY